MSSLTGWVKNEEDYSLFLLNVNPFNNNLAGKHCYYTGKFTLARCALKSCTLLLNYAEQSHFLLFPAPYHCKDLVYSMEIVFDTWWLKLPRLPRLYIRRGNWQVWVERVTLGQVPVILQPWCDGLLPRAQPPWGAKPPWFCSASVTGILN